VSAGRLVGTATLVVAAFAVAAGATPTAAAESYQYDTVGRLTDAGYANGGSIHFTYDLNGNVLSIVTSLAVTAVDGGAPALQFALGAATPNPGSGARRIPFTIPAPGHVTLRVFDVTGREVATLYNRVLDAGHYNAQFSTDRWGNGVYFYRLEAAGHVRAGRLVVLR
jgi:YD repeat-containing protein